MNRVRRIAFLSEHASPVALLGGEDAGGQNVYVDELSRRLGQSGYEVDVFTRCHDFDDPDTVDWADGVRVINLKIGPPRFLPKDDLWPLMPQFVEAIVDFADDEGRDYDLIHSNFWMSGWAAVQLKRRLGLPVAHIFHATGVTKRRHQGDADTSPNERIAVEKEIVRCVNRIIAQCPAEVEELVGHYEAPRSKLAVISSGVDVDRFRPISRRRARQALGLPLDAFVIVYVGRMVPRKGVRNVVRALALLLEQRHAQAGDDVPPIHFLVVGGESPDPDPQFTPEIGVLQELARELDVDDHVTFTGCKPPQELYTYYCAGDVAVTTPWYEPFGLTPLEAMACGRPVIGAAVGGIKHTVADRVTGFLVPPKDPRALADSLYRLMSNEALRNQMARAARTHIEQEFTWATTARRTAALYEQLLCRPRTPVTIPQRRYRPQPNGRLLLKETARGAD